MIECLTVDTLATTDILADTPDILDVLTALIVDTTNLWPIEDLPDTPLVHLIEILLDPKC